MPNQLEIPTNPMPAEVDTDLRADELTGSAGYFVRTDLHAGVCNCDTTDRSTQCCAIVC
ncbi:MAG: hypothetical protein KA765_05825 [Thermoflexales bacterium]|nr:hypothetical protein [Thermoflexales bacterium]